MLDALLAEYIVSAERSAYDLVPAEWLWSGGSADAPLRAMRAVIRACSCIDLNIRLDPRAKNAIQLGLDFTFDEARLALGCVFERVAV